MYVPYRETTQLNFKFPWERNTARGFGMALVITALLILLISWVKVEKEKPIDISFDTNTIPLELLNFGDGDGTGMSKGNLSREGMAHKGSQVLNDLEDASVAAKTKFNKSSVDQDPTSSNNLVAQSELQSANKNKDINDNANGSKNTGKPNGSINGQGIGDKGDGKGWGEGYGPIEWGGGGNRTVLYKKLPKYPSGVNTNAQIKIKFTVAADGTVTNWQPLQRGDPMLEKAAIDALRQWRFNRLQNNKEMYGIITFTFRLS